MVGPALVSNELYKFTIVLRATGSWYFIEGGIYADQTLLYASQTDSDANSYVGFANQTANVELMSIGVVTDLWAPVPLASDGFGAASFGSTDGLGHPEGVAASLGAGGGGKTWSEQQGTLQNTGGVADFTALGGGGIGAATVATNTPDVFGEITVSNYASGSAGLLLRYVDTSNYIYAGYDGTNAVIVERVADTPNTLVSSAKDLGAGKIQAAIDGSSVRMWFNGAHIGAESINAAAQSSNNHGLLSIGSSANTFDNLVLWSRK